MWAAGEISTRSLGQMEMLKPAPTDQSLPSEPICKVSAQVRMSWVGCSSFGSAGHWHDHTASSSGFTALCPKHSEIWSFFLRRLAVYLVCRGIADLGWEPMKKGVLEGICSTTQSTVYLEVSDSLSQATVVTMSSSFKDPTPGLFNYQVKPALEWSGGAIGLEISLLLSQRENAGSFSLAGNRTKCTHAFTLKRDRLDYYFCKTKKPRDKQEKTRETVTWKVRIEPG